MFQVTIQLPFEQKERHYADCSPSQAMVLYQTMDWQAMEQAMFQRQDEVVHHYYYIEIVCLIGDGQQQTLVVSGYLDSTVSIDYARPKWVKKGLFKKKDVLEPSYLTQMEGVSLEFGKTCFEAFLRRDDYHLETNLYDKRIED